MVHANKNPFYEYEMLKIPTAFTDYIKQNNKIEHKKVSLKHKDFFSSWF